MPEELYEALAERARRERRSLAQQAIADLSGIEEFQARTRRQAVIDQIRGRDLQDSAVSDPVAMMREDRER